MNRRSFLGSLAGAAWAGNAAAAPDTGPLGDHRITSIETRRARLPWPRLVGKNARLDVHGRGPTCDVCMLRTDRGADGWGMVQGRRFDAERLREPAIGRTVDELFAADRGIRSPRWRPLDIALHDLAGAILGVPVWRLLGAARPTVTRVYSGMIYFDDLEPPGKPAGIDKVLENCRWDRRHGYRQLKVKIGRGNRWMDPEAGLRRDIEVVRAIAREVPDCEILVDGNNGFTADRFIRFLEGIDGIPLFWIEEPFHETLADWRKLAAWTRANGYQTTHLADGEYDPDARVLEQLEREDAITIRLEDIVGLGFSRWRAFLRQLADRGTAASPHAWGEGLKTVYIAHLAGALGNIPTIEGVTCGDQDVDFGDNRIEDGRFIPSSEPGFGMKLRE